MSTSIDQAFITAYSAEVHEVFQRRGTFLKDAVFFKTNVVGSTASFHKINKGTATTKTTPSHLDGRNTFGSTSSLCTPRPVLAFGTS